MERKQAVFVLVLLATFGAGLSQAALAFNCNPTDASNQNHVAIKFLKEKGVELEATPAVQASSCGGLFSATGTCCKVESINTWTRFANQYMIERWKGYIAKLSKIASRFKAPLQKIQPRMSLADLRNKIDLVKNRSPEIASRFAKVFDILPANEQELLALKDTISNFDDHLATFRKSGAQCFDHMKRYRANAICALCSAKAGEFISKDERNPKIRIPQADCNKLVDSCISVWRFNLFLLSAIQYVNLVRSSKPNSSATLRYKNLINYDVKAVEALRDGLARCKVDSSLSIPSLTCNVTGTAKDISSIRRDLCKHIFSVNKVNALLEGYEDVDEGLEAADLMAAEADLPVVASARLLQVTDPKLPLDTDANVGIEVSTSSEPTFAKIDESTEVVSPETIDSSKAGEQGVPASARNLLLTGLPLFLMAAFLL